jgi:outer membrane protein OmpA-like peptidoglycan-associated protein
MRLLTLGILGFLLAAVYWVGATVYSERIEQDITERSTAALAEYSDDLSVSVDGRDVTVVGAVSSENERDQVRSVANSVWGVRKTAEQLTIEKEVEAAPRFDFEADYENQKLHMSGTVDDDDTVAMINNIHKALPPSTLISTGVIGTGAAELIRSPEKVETGIAALTQLNRGDLKITDEDFILNGVVSDEARRDAIERLIATRADALKPLDVQLNIDIDPYTMITQACRDAMKTATHGNVLNYKVDYSNIESRYTAQLDAVASVINGVCAGQVTHILVESHADVTGGEGYNQGLSERRADTVHDYLIGKGVPQHQITAFGYGEFRPIATNETVEGRAQNRRTEIHFSTDPLNLSINSEE